MAQIVYAMNQKKKGSPTIPGGIVLQLGKVEIAKWQCVGTTSTKKFFSLKIVLQEHWSGNAYI